MKLIKPYFEIWEQEEPNINKMDIDYSTKRHMLLKAIYQQIERAGRTCYKSEDKITDDSCWGFVDRMIQSHHYAMLEHGTVYLTASVPKKDWGRMYTIYDHYKDNPYSKTYYKTKGFKGDEDFNIIYVTTNYRVIIENNWNEDLEWISNPTEYHQRRHTVHFVCNRQVSHEFVRHRVFSFAQESTRYCNYTKGKFGGELTFIAPIWCNENLCEMDKWKEHHFDIKDLHLLEQFGHVETNYFELINDGWKPQEAATILPNAIKTELIMTGFESDWVHFFDLRALGTTGAPHPQAKELAEPLYNEFKNRQWLWNQNSK